MRSEMCSLHLTHPSGAVGSRHCSARGAVGGSVPCSRASPQSRTLTARARSRTHNLGLPRVSNPMLYPLGHDCPRMYGNVQYMFNVWIPMNTNYIRVFINCFLASISYKFYQRLSHLLCLSQIPHCLCFTGFFWLIWLQQNMKTNAPNPLYSTLSQLLADLPGPKLGIVAHQCYINLKSQDWRRNVLLFYY